MDSLEGKFLLASQKLLDQNFVKTVVLMVQHNNQGALGVVVNRPTSKNVQELWREVGDSPCESTRPVHLGGPVSGPIMSVHTSAKLAEIEIIPGVFFAAKKQHLDELVLQRDRPFKIFVGHAGWGPGQLEGELEAGAWHILPATAEYVFYEDENLWEQASRQIGRSVLESMLDIKEVPEDPSLN
jgi:putative transcriptional regulator